MTSSLGKLVNTLFLATAVTAGSLVATINAENPSYSSNTKPDSTYSNTKGAEKKEEKCLWTLIDDHGEKYRYHVNFQDNDNYSYWVQTNCILHYLWY